MERISKRVLDTLVERLNAETDSPQTPWTRKEGDTRATANIGNFHLSQAYGGYCVHRMFNEGGGVTTPIVASHIPARELYGLIHAFLRGLEFARKEAQQ